MKKNQGYSMVELIIVIAVMAILSGMSFITIGIIKQAHIQDAYTTLGNQMSALLTKTRAVSQPVNNSDGGQLCMKLHYVPEKTTYGEKTVSAGSYVIIFGKINKSGAFEALEENKVDSVLTNRTRITFATSSAKNTEVDVSDSDVLIQFNKATGQVVSGSGYYRFYDGDSVYATVYLDKATGSHTIK